MLALLLLLLIELGTFLLIVVIYGFEALLYRSKRTLDSVQRRIRHLRELLHRVSLLLAEFLVERSLDGLDVLRQSHLHIARNRLLKRRHKLCKGHVLIVWSLGLRRNFSLGSFHLSGLFRIFFSGIFHFPLSRRFNIPFCGIFHILFSGIFRYRLFRRSILLNLRHYI